MNKYFLTLAVACALICGSSLPCEAYSDDIPVSIDSRIKTLIYNENEVFEIKFHYGYQSFIEFSPDEEIEIISLGEAFPWKLTPTDKRIFVRPLETGVHTNMTIVTTRRTYQFEISSSEYDGRADEELVYSVRFYYPKDNKLSIPKVELGSAVATNATAIQQELAQSNPPSDIKDLPRDKKRSVLNFDYSKLGDADEIIPTKVYDDGLFTYFQFPNNNLIIPTISYVDINGSETRARYKVVDGFVVVKGVSTQFTLRLADRLVCIFNDLAVKKL